MTECPICCEKYNNSTKKNITCPYDNCEFTACKSCIRTYLLNTSADPNCMNCKKPFNDEFLVKKKNPLELPPDFDQLPTPKKDEENMEKLLRQRNLKI